MMDVHYLIISLIGILHPTQQSRSLTAFVVVIVVEKNFLLFGIWRNKNGGERKKYIDKNSEEKIPFSVHFQILFISQIYIII